MAVKPLFMRGRREERIEAAVDQIAAAVLAGAVAFAAFKLLGAALPVWQVAVATGLSAAGSYLVCSALLGRVAAERQRFTVTPFEVADVPLVEADELLLTEQVELLLNEPAELLLTEPAELILTNADRVPPHYSEADELLLDDILAQMGPDSRVVRLFDRAAMPTPGQLNARIERHLRGAPVAAAPYEPVDASEALHEALAELRRSLR